MVNRFLRDLLGFREFISQRVCCPALRAWRGVFILCWHHKDNQLLSMKH